MRLFQNGMLFRLALRCCPPPGHKLPMVTVQLASTVGDFTPVIGKVDTGASRSMFNFDTAHALGIDDPTVSALKTGIAYTASGEEMEYHVHSVLVQVGTDAGEPITFPLEAAFAKKVKRNLLGVDWLEHLCVAVDSQAVHFLCD